MIDDDDGYRSYYPIFIPILYTSRLHRLIDRQANLLKGETTFHFKSVYHILKPILYLSIIY